MLLYLQDDEVPHFWKGVGGEADELVAAQISVNITDQLCKKGRNNWLQVLIAFLLNDKPDEAWV